MNRLFSEPHREFKYDLFISYNRKDATEVYKLDDRLKTSGFQMFLDKDSIQGGEKWMDSLVEGLDHSAACVIFLALMQSLGSSDDFR